MNMSDLNETATSTTLAPYPKKKLPIKMIRLHDDVIMPSKGTAGASCYDIHAYLKERVSIPPHGRAMIPTGLSPRLPEDMEIRIRSRSGLPLKNGVIIGNGSGTVDSDYHGEICVILINTDPTMPYVVEPGARIAQMAIEHVIPTDLVDVPYTEPTSERGEGGFGSTGM